MSDAQPDWQRRAKATWHARYHDQYAQRDQQIAAQRQAGMTFRQIGLAHGISGNRVWQICRREERRFKRRARLIAWRIVAETLSQGAGRLTMGDIVSNGP